MKYSRASLRKDITMRKTMHIIVFRRTYSREEIIADIPNAFSHRNRVEELLESLNTRYVGSTYYTSVQCW